MNTIRCCPFAGGILWPVRVMQPAKKAECAAQDSLVVLFVFGVATTAGLPGASMSKAKSSVLPLSTIGMLPFLVCPLREQE